MNATWDGSEPCPYPVDYIPLSDDECGRDTRSFECNSRSIDDLMQPTSGSNTVLARESLLGGMLTVIVTTAMLL